tara:strand:- start:898 stop:1137 length:240 start_codon:yes stop_codon:yes gene_type:complete
MSLLYLYLNQPPSRTGVVSRQVVIYFIPLTKGLIIATFLVGQAVSLPIVDLKALSFSTLLVARAPLFHDEQDLHLLPYS